MALRQRIPVRKVKQSTAMKTAMRASLEDRSSTARLTHATLSPSIFSTAGSITEALASFDEDFFDAHGVIARPAMEQPSDGDAIIFHDFCVAGLIPPFSEFFMAVLETYGLHMLHLDPNAVVILSLFAYVCEAYVGVVPSIALFCHYFVPHTGRSRWVSGCITFRLWPEVEAQFPEVVVDRSKEWRRNWYIIQANSISPHLCEPSGLAERLAYS